MYQGGIHRVKLGRRRELCSRRGGRWPADDRLDGPRRPGHGRGRQHLYCRTCDQTTRPWVSLRDRRDTRLDAHHLLRHPDLRRPAVPDPPAVDGDDAGTRPVRPGRQADAALRHVQARRHRGLHAARGLGPRRSADAVHQAGDRRRRRHDRDPRRQGLSSTASSSSSRTSSRRPTGRPRTRRIRSRRRSGSCRTASCSSWATTARCRPIRASSGPVEIDKVIGRAWLRYWPINTLTILPTPDPSGAPSRRCRRRRREPRSRGPRLRRRGGGGRRGLSPRGPGGAARTPRRAPGGSRSSPTRCPARSPIAARLASAFLACRLIAIAIRDLDEPTSGSRLGWPVEALAAAAAAVIGFGTHGLGAPGEGPAEAQAAGFAVGVLAASPIVSSRDVFRLGIGCDPAAARRAARPTGLERDAIGARAARHERARRRPRRRGRGRDRRGPRGGRWPRGRRTGRRDGVDAARRPAPRTVTILPFLVICVRPRCRITPGSPQRASCRRRSGSWSGGCRDRRGSDRGGRQDDRSVAPS